jgi:GT2 family glycosyltransferase
MKLSVVILNWNTRDLLRDCLAAIGRNSPGSSYEAIVVDNGSTDGSPAMVRAEFPRARLIETGSNLGFAGGNNVGLRAARGEYRLLLNSDAEVQPGALDRLTDYMDRHPRAGACGAQLVYPDGRLQPSGSTFITLRTLFFEQFLLDKAFPRSSLFAEHFLSDWHYRARRNLDALSGACLMMRTACLRKVGLLDANYFMYCEDVDWCLRAARAGWDRTFLPEARVLHHHGASSRSVRAEMVAIYNRSRCYYFRKFYGIETARQAQRLMIGGARFRRLLWSLKATRGGPESHAAIQAEGWKEIARKTAQIDLDALPPPGDGEGRLSEGW